jgi:dihydrofolate reductase
MLSVTDRIYLTEIHQPFAGDAKFPELTNDFVEVERRARKEPIPFDFVTYERKQIKS